MQQPQPHPPRLALQCSPPHYHMRRSTSIDRRPSLSIHTKDVVQPHVTASLLPSPPQPTSFPHPSHFTRAEPNPLPPAALAPPAANKGNHAISRPFVAELADRALTRQAPWDMTSCNASCAIDIGSTGISISCVNPQAHGKLTVCKRTKS